MFPIAELVLVTRLASILCPSEYPAYLTVARVSTSGYLTRRIFFRKTTFFLHGPVKSTVFKSRFVRIGSVPSARSVEREVVLSRRSPYLPSLPCRRQPGVHSVSLLPYIRVQRLTLRYFSNDRRERKQNRKRRVSIPTRYTLLRHRGVDILFRVFKFRTHVFIVSIVLADIPVSGHYSILALPVRRV